MSFCKKQHVAMTRRHMQAFSDSPLHPTRAWPVCITIDPPPTSPRCPHNNLTISVVPALGLPVPQHPCANYPPTLFQPPPSPPSPHSLAGQCWAPQEPNGLWRTGDGRCSWALSLEFPARGAEPHWTLPQPLTSAHCPTQHETAPALSQA